MQQVDELGLMYLAAENGRISTHTAALLVLGPPGRRLTVGRLRALVHDRLDLIPAFGRRLVGVPFGLDRPYWIEAEPDLDYHVREISLPRPGDDDQLREQVGRIFSRPLDRSRPLWEMYLIQGLANGRTAVLTKVHHAVADGRAGAQMITLLTDSEPRPRQAGTRLRPAIPPPPAFGPMLVRGLAGVVRQPWRAVRSVPAVLSGLDELPVVGTTPAARLIGVATALARRTPRHTALRTAPRTAFNRRVSRHRRIGFATMSFDDVRLVKSRFTVTVNDVVMAIAAGAVRRWLVEHDELPDRPLTAVVPVSLHNRRTTDFGNDLSAVVVPIPTDVDDPVLRLKSAHAAMLAALHDLATTAPDALAGTIRLVPPPLVGGTAHLLTHLNAWAPLTPAMNVNISNVPGPPQQLYLAGARIESVVPLAGITDGLGLNITVMSYHGRLQVGIVADRDQLPDVQRIADWTTEELATLVRFAGR